MKDFNILIIDDEQSQIVSLKSFLTRRGYKIYSANSGIDGIKIVKNENVDLVITDYRMPEMGLRWFKICKK
jgi:CheY-like chemotaxis protein